MKIVGYQICLRITRFVILVIRPDYQTFCLSLRSTPGHYRASLTLCLRQIYMEGLINDSWRNFERKFGIETILLTINLTPHINLTPFDGIRYSFRNAVRLFMGVDNTGVGTRSAPEASKLLCY